jgi:hypothetical protein
MAGLTDNELRARGVPEAVIHVYRSSVRRWSAPLRKVMIDGVRYETLDEKRERRQNVSDEVARRIAGARLPGESLTAFVRRRFPRVAA